MTEEIFTPVKSPSRYMLWFGWIGSLALIAFFAFIAGKNSQGGTSVEPTQPASPTPTVVQVLGIETSPTPSIDLNGICKKSGVSQKKDYLASYIIKEGDSLQSIAKQQLGDEKRLDELIKLNDGGQGLSIGSTVYLPPSWIKQSSGNLVQASGMIVRKDNAVWQISYGGGVSGLGIAIPTYYLNDIQNKDEFSLGDCVTVLIDNGVKVYLISKQE